MKTATVEIPVIREFLNNWKNEAYEFYLEKLESLRAELQGVKPTNWERRNALRQKYGELVFKANYYGNSAPEHLRKEIELDAEAKYHNIVSKIQKVCGEVTEAKYLHIAGNGELNGYLIGTEGNAEVKTIGAGGYNIQRFHFRTLVKKY